MSLRSVKGRVVFSAKISTLKPLTALSLYVSKNVEIYRLTGRSPSTVPRGGWGCRGQSPLHSPPIHHGTSVGGLGGTIGRRKRAVDALASTVPFFGVADELPRGGLSRGTWNSGLSEAREHMP